MDNKDTNNNKVLFNLIKNVLVVTQNVFVGCVHHTDICLSFYVLNKFCLISYLMMQKWDETSWLTAEIDLIDKLVR